MNANIGQGAMKMSIVRRKHIVDVKILQFQFSTSTYQNFNLLTRILGVCKPIKKFRARAARGISFEDFLITFT